MWRIIAPSGHQSPSPEEPLSQPSLPPSAKLVKPERSKGLQSVSVAASTHAKTRSSGINA